MSDDTDPYYCATEDCTGLIVGEVTTGVQVIPELADLVGDGGLIEDVELLCADCLGAS